MEPRKQIEKLDKLQTFKISIVGLIGLLTVFNTYMALDAQEVFDREVSPEEVMPEGEPAVYGSELGIKYDDVSKTQPRKADETLGKLAEYDQEIKVENLTEGQRRRYIEVASSISCEYCCDVPAIIRRNGEPACVCQHSKAMRGLAKYLITEHGDEFTNEEILSELSKWKVRSFPQQHVVKGQALVDEGIKLNYINLASNEHRDIQKSQQSGGGMVGSC